MTVTLDHPLETGTEIRLFLVEGALSLAFARLAEKAFTGVSLSAASIDRLESEARAYVVGIPHEFVVHGLEAAVPPIQRRALDDVHAFFDILRALRSGVQ